MALPVGAKKSQVVFPIEIRKNVVPRLAGREERFVGLAALQHFVKFVEAQNVVLRPACGVIHRRAGFHEKRPVARLRE